MNSRSAAPDELGRSGITGRPRSDQSPRPYRLNLARLAAAQKSGVGVPPYTRYLNRPLGRRLAAAFAGTRLTPNGVTWLSLLASFSGLTLFCLFPPSIGVGLVVGVFLVLGYALDSADGQLARLRGTGGPAGEWLDHVGDQFRQICLHGAVAVYLFRFVDGLPSWVLLLPLWFGVVVSTRFVSQVLAEQLRHRAGPPSQAGPPAESDRSAARRALLQTPADPGVLCVVFLTAGLPSLFLGCYLVLLMGNTVLAAASLRRRFVELASLQ